MVEEVANLRLADRQAVVAWEQRPESTELGPGCGIDHCPNHSVRYLCGFQGFETGNARSKSVTFVAKILSITTSSDSPKPTRSITSAFVILAAHGDAICDVAAVCAKAPRIAEYGNHQHRHRQRHQAVAKSALLANSSNQRRIDATPN